MEHNPTKLRGMKNLLREEWRCLWRPWCLCVLLPLPFLLFQHSPEGRSYALKAFFLSCLILVAYSFRRDVAEGSVPDNRTSTCGYPGLTPPGLAWRDRMWPLALALLAASAVFSVVCVVFNNPHDFGTARAEQVQGIWWRAFVFDTPRDFAAPMLAFMTIVPALGIVPYFVLVTRKPFAAIVFAAFLEGCMKFLGAIVVVLVYGWDADKQGRTKMPWNDPDLLVWLFWIFSAALSLTFFILGARKFQVLRERA